MVPVVLLVIGVGALALIFFREHMKDLALNKLDQKKAADQVTLNALQAAVPALEKQAEAQQANATEAEKDAFWQKELNDQNTPSSPNKQ